MTKPIWPWNRTLSRLGFARHKGRRPDLQRKGRPLKLEFLEPRRLLEVDLAITGFSAMHGQLVVDYDVLHGRTEPFQIGIYRSTDGETLGEQLMTYEVSDPLGDLSVGVNTVSFDARFSSDHGDDGLVAVLDSTADVREADESNNRLRFQGGPFELHVSNGPTDRELNALVRLPVAAGDE